ncbi:MAG: ribonuclease [Bacteroidota bacterium]
MITFETEAALALNGLLAIGVDEAGRGALAGPVVAAAVILDPLSIPSGIDDSKRLSPERRHALAASIRASALAWGIGCRSACRIDEINILQATFEAMHEAIEACRAAISMSDEHLHLLVDGNRFRPHSIGHTTIVQGDARVMSIAAASILAKTHRDAILTDELAPQHPEYGFERHKGYGTAFHREMIRADGPCAEHRRSFLGKILAAKEHGPADIQ